MKYADLILVQSMLESMVTSIRSLYFGQVTKLCVNSHDLSLEFESLGAHSSSQKTKDDDICTFSLYEWSYVLYSVYFHFYIQLNLLVALLATVSCDVWAVTLFLFQLTG